MENTLQSQESEKSNKPLVWDCGSNLYDSFELKSFKRQLDSAISSRTLSMPHFSDRQTPHTATAASVPISKSTPSKFSRSLSKLLRSLFKTKPNSNPSIFRGKDQPRDGFYVFFEAGSLSTIPEVPEADIGAAFSPEISSMVRKTNSERFTANSLGISCA